MIDAMALLMAIALSVLASVATAALVRNGGHGSPPRSHRRDDRFMPPSSLVH